MRALCGIAGSLFTFAFAAGRCEKLAPPRDQWPWILVFAMLNYALFVVLTTEARVYLTASEAVTITYTLPIWHLADLSLDFGVADAGGAIGQSERAVRHQLNRIDPGGHQDAG
jgi:hypothetical protein